MLVLLRHLAPPPKLRSLAVRRGPWLLLLLLLLLLLSLPADARRPDLQRVQQPLQDELLAGREDRNDSARTSEPSRSAGPVHVLDKTTTASGPTVVVQRNNA
jgi:hypothetical protein